MQGPEPYWQSWTFDSLGDILTRTDHAPAGNTGGDTTTTYSYSAPGSAHAVSSISATNTVSGSQGSTSYGYNGAGQTTTLGSQSLTWTPNGQLVTAGTTSAPVSYAYDADGNQIVENDNGATTLYLPDEQITASASTTIGVRYYSFAGKIIAMTTGATGSTGVTLFWLDGNPQGSTTTAVAAFSQSTVIRREFTPYGTALNSSGTWPDNRGFLGDPNPSATGLVDIGARKYNPATGLFISVDPNLNVASPQTMTGYTYAADSPVTNSDPTGLMFMMDGGGGGGYVAPTYHYAPPIYYSHDYYSYPAISHVVPHVPIWSGFSFRCPGTGCTAANVSAYSGGVVAAGITAQTNWDKLRWYGNLVGYAKKNLARGPDDPYNIEQGLSASDLNEGVPAARAALLGNMGTTRFGIPTTRLGWGTGVGLSVVGGAVGAYGEWNATNHDWGKTIEVGAADTAINFGAGVAGAAAGGFVSGVLAGGLLGAEVGAFAGPIGLVAGAVVGAAISMVATTVVTNVINDLNPFNW